MLQRKFMTKGNSVRTIRGVSDPQCLLFVPGQSEFVSLAEMEDLLLRNLFQGYQRWVRPIQHSNSTIRVRFGLKISQLVDVVRNTHPCTYVFMRRCIILYSRPSHRLLLHISALFFTIILPKSLRCLQNHWWPHLWGSRSRSYFKNVRLYVSHVISY